MESVNSIYFPCIFRGNLSGTTESIRIFGLNLESELPFFCFPCKKCLKKIIFKDLTGIVQAAFMNV